MVLVLGSYKPCYPWHWLGPSSWIQLETRLGEPRRGQGSDFPCPNPLHQWREGARVPCP